MKRTFLISLLALALALAVGCTPATPPAPSPSPMAPATPMASPSPAGENGNGLAEDGLEGVENGTVPSGQIDGFEEGKTVNEADLPQQVADAIKKAYSDVKIKTITYVTYLSDQVYRVVLEEPTGEDKVQEFYVKADGTIVPAEGDGDAGSNNTVS